MTTEKERRNGDSLVGKTCRNLFTFFLVSKVLTEYLREVSLIAVCIPFFFHKCFRNLIRLAAATCFTKFISVDFHVVYLSYAVRKKT